MASKPGRQVVVTLRPDPAKLLYKRNGRTTQDLAKLLEENKRIFIAGIDRRSSYYYRMRMETILGETVEASQAAYGSEEGYAFELKPKV